MLRWFAFVAVCFFCLGCTPNIGKPGLELGDGKDLKRKVVGASEGSAKAAYKVGKQKGTAEYFTCKGAPSGSYILMINPDNVIFEKGICRDWHAQTFLSSGYSVIAVNRP